MSTGTAVCHVQRDGMEDCQLNESTARLITSSLPAISLAREHDRAVQGGDTPAWS